MEKDELIEIHPGRVILEEFLAPRGISVWHLAKELGLPARQVYEIVQGQRSITPDTARRLAHYFGLSERFWLRLQAVYDLEVRKARLGRSNIPDASECIGSRGYSTANPPGRKGSAACRDQAGRAVVLR